MKVHPSREVTVNLESVAMTDIVLNMFIFFFISFSLLYTFSPSRVAKFEIRLPQASSATTVQEGRPLVVTITHNGRYFLGERPVNSDQLRQALEAACGVDAHQLVVVRADALTSCKDLVRVFDLARTVGFDRLAIGVQEAARGGAFGR